MKEQFYVVVDSTNIFFINKDTNEINQTPIDIHEGIKSIKWCIIDQIYYVAIKLNSDHSHFVFAFEQLNPQHN